jgi:hypothetical protein
MIDYYLKTLLLKKIVVVVVVVVVVVDNVVAHLFKNASSGSLGQDSVVGRVNRLVVGPTQDLSQWVQDAVSRGRKELVHAADHFPQFSADIKNDSNCLSRLLCMHSWHTQGLYTCNITCISRFIGIEC